jgi:uncharacterized membrane protein YczE
MSSSDLTRWSRLAAIVAAALLVVGDLLDLTVLFSPEPFSEEAQTGSYIFRQALFLLGVTLLFSGWSGCTPACRRPLVP